MSGDLVLESCGLTLSTLNLLNVHREETANQVTSTQAATADITVDGEADTNKTEADDQTKKKRKRRAEVTVADETDTKQKQATAAEDEVPPDMGPVDYAANYFQFLIQRELAKSPQDESEDVCFCCKDGGELIECDWPGEDHKYARCPKVYHEGNGDVVWGRGYCSLSAM